MLMKNKEIIKFIFALLFFIFSIVFKEYVLVYTIIGYLIISFEMIIELKDKIPKGKIFDEEFLMIIATIGAFILKDYHEGFMVMLLYQLGEIINDHAVDKSKEEIIKLMDLDTDTVTLSTKDGLTEIEPNKVKIGDIILVKAGEKIPLDGYVFEGSSNIDTSSITGEHKPRSVKIKDPVLSGCINLDGTLKIKVTEIYKNSTANKIIDLIEKADKKKSNTEKVVDKFASIYTPIVVALALLLFLVPGFITKDFSLWGHRALVFLVASCPCALVISIPLAYFVGMGACSKSGILMKNSNTLDKLLKIDEIIFDKTGTITEGVFEVVKVKGYGIKASELLEIAATCESLNNHPIALSILNRYGKDVDNSKIKNYKIVDGGITLSIDKDKYIIGNYNLLNKNKIDFERCLDIGTIVYISRNKEYLGYILINDKIKKNSKKTISLLREKGFNELVVLSGDNEEIVNDVVKRVGIKRYMSELLPIDKVNYLKTAHKEKKKTMFVGDGINDAPALLTSDIGVSMGGIGSDASIEASDMVIMNDDLTKIHTAHNIASFTKKIVIENIVLVLLIKLLVLTLATFGYANMIAAVFADVGVTLITILNTFRILKKRD